MITKLEPILNWTKTHMGHWSPVHYIFDACITGVIVTIFGSLTKMLWHEQLLLALFVFGAIASGMMIFLRPASSDTKASFSQDVVAVHTEIDEYLASLKTISEWPNDPAWYKWCNSVAAGISGSLGVEECHKFWEAVDGNLDADVKMEMARRYLRGLATRIPTR